MPSASSAKPSAFAQPSFTPALTLLGLAIVINYVDRGNLSIAAPMVQSELRLSATQLGFLFSAFFYTYMGLKFGPAVGAFGAGLLIAEHGWRSVFFWMGLASLLWVPAWFRWKPAAPASPAIRAPALIGYVAIFKQRYFWGCSAGHFCFNYLSYFFLTWLPSYLAQERHLSQRSLSKAAAAYYLVDAASALFTGWLCDRLIISGIRASLV